MSEIANITGKTIDYLPLAELRKYPRNPKEHDLGAILESFARFGFMGALSIDETSGCISEGHGRVDALYMLKAKGRPAPRGIKADGDTWLVPVIRGDAFDDTDELEAFLIASNKTVMAGGWDEPLLADVLGHLQIDSTLDGTGFDSDDLDTLIKWQGDAILGRDDEKEQYEAVDYDAEAAPGVEPGEQALYPLAIVLTRKQYDAWQAYKDSAGVKKDTDALLALLEI